MENQYLLVGLGNPGSEYARTRHNAGFLVLDHLAERWKVSWLHEKKFKARIARTESGGRKLLLCQPQTYMNLSGEAVSSLAQYHKIEASQMLVVVDDADLSFGEIRLRPKGSSGGHHGLESIERHLGTREFPRQRIGIGRGADGAREITGYVLGAFRPRESEMLEKVLQKAGDQIECWFASGLGPAMNQFNGVIKI